MNKKNPETESFDASKQWTARFSSDVNVALSRLKKEVGFKQDSDILRHIITIYLTERRLIK